MASPNNVNTDNSTITDNVNTDNITNDDVNVNSTNTPTSTNVSTQSITNPYFECDIYELFNEMDNKSTLLLDVRTKDDYDSDNIKNSEYFDIPANFKFTSPQDLLFKLDKNISEFKLKVFNKLKYTQKDNLLIIAYGNHSTSLNGKFNILYQLLLAFGLRKNQLKILNNPGFELFQSKFLFLCSKYIKQQENDLSFSSIFDMIKNKNKKLAINPHDGSDASMLGDISSDREYPNSIISDKLYLGNGQHATNKKVLQQLNITHIINATVKISNKFQNILNIQYLQLAIDDNEFENFDVFWDNIMDFMKCLDKNDNKNDDDDNKNNNNNANIDEMKKIETNNNNNAVLIHCEMGISRSSTIVIAYLMNKLKMTLFDAYYHVLNRRNMIRPNSAFLKQLELFEKKLFNGVTTVDKVHSEIRQIYLNKLVNQQNK